MPSTANCNSQIAVDGVQYEEVLIVIRSWLYLDFRCWEDPCCGNPGIVFVSLTGVES